MLSTLPCIDPLEGTASEEDFLKWEGKGTLRIDNCDERSDYNEGDISGLKDAIIINDISIESPDFSILYDII